MNKQLLLYGFGALLLASCTPEPAEPNADTADASHYMSFLAGDGNYYGRLTLMTSTGGMATQHVYNYVAEIFNNSERKPVHLVDPGGVTIGNLELQPRSNGNAVVYGVQETDADSPEHVRNTGQVINWSVQGNPDNGTPAFSTDMYMPANVVLTLPKGKSFSKAEGLLCRWNADPENPGKTFIHVEYRTFWSHRRDPNLPNERRAFTVEVDNRIGERLLTPKELEDMPVGGEIDVTLVRGNMKMVTAADRDYQLLGYALGSQLAAVLD